MKQISFFLLLSFAILNSLTAQKDEVMEAKPDLPYREIPANPESYTPGSVAARTVDGLGYRYYWATEDLREKDLAFKPGEDGRSALETLEHIYGLTQVILNTVKKKPNIRPASEETLTFPSMRKKTLENLREASDLLRGAKGKDLKKMSIVFQRGENRSELPFWNLLNGPIADALYHTGQIVSYRRSAGNPMHSGVNVLLGKTRE